MTDLLRPAILSLLVSLTCSGTLLAQDAKDDSRYRVVINHEEQYSIWLAGKDAPKGWKALGEPCQLKDCHAYIEEVWTDMRPLSLRKRMEEEGLKVEGTKFRVVINHEEQYSVALADSEPPKGWKATRFAGSLDEAHEYIEEVWTDMRPLSLRKRLDKTSLDKR